MTISRIRVQTAAPYEVAIGTGVSGELAALLGEDVRQVAIIFGVDLETRADSLKAELTERGYAVQLIAVPSGEAAKTAHVAQFCWGILGRCGFTRSDAIVGLGGGATTDLAGFVAASWLRGVKFVTVPTTVLGMVDAAVGGKTGINTDEGKNLVGAFHEPAGVLCDLEALRSLPAAEVRSGLAEIIKCGFIADPSILELIEAAPGAALDVNSQILAELIEKSIAVKAATVGADLREAGGFDGSIGREALNYGHTLAHAIERHENYGFRHGEAVAIGMVFVAKLARLAGHITPDVAARHRRILELVGLPTTYRPGVWDELHAAMKVDKKSRGNQLRFVILDGLANPAILTGPDERLLQTAYREISV